MTPLSLATERQDATLRVRVSGELDLMSEAELTAYLLRAVADPSATSVVVDVSGVEFIDSCGLRALLTGREAADRADRELLLATTAGPVTRLLDIAGVRGWFRYE